MAVLEFPPRLSLSNLQTCKGREGEEEERREGEEEEGREGEEEQRREGKKEEGREGEEGEGREGGGREEGGGGGRREGRNSYSLHSQCTVKQSPGWSQHNYNR